MRYVSPALQAESARADGRSGGPQRRRRAEAGAVRDRAHRSSRRRTPASARAGGRGADRGGTSRVFVVNGDRAEERIVTVGQTVEALVEITNGLKAGERVATTERRRSSRTARHVAV